MPMANIPLKAVIWPNSTGWHEWNFFSNIVYDPKLIAEFEFSEKIKKKLFFYPYKTTYL